MWISKVLKRVLMGYDCHITDKVYIKDLREVILIKDLQIFKNYKTKTFIKLLNYNKRKLTCQDFFSKNYDKKSKELMSTYTNS